MIYFPSVGCYLQGGFGVDFSNTKEMSPEALHECAAQLPSTGVTSFCPTLISCDTKDYTKLIPLFSATDGRDTKAASILGLHLEGPYFSTKKVGAHPPQHIRTPKQIPLEKVYGGAANLEHVRIITCAPELDGAEEMIQRFTDMSYAKGPGKRIISIGHSNATISDAGRGVSSGATMITHLFNAMGGFHHRDPGIVGLLGRHELHPSLFYGIIADGLHAHPTSVSIAFNSHPKGLVLVTDAMSALGLPEGVHKLGDSEVEVKPAPWGKRRAAKKAVIAGTDTLAGAIVSMAECVQNFKSFTGCSTAVALEAATLHPARVLGIEETKGTLGTGADGDVVLLDRETLCVEATYIKGTCVFSRS